MDADALVEALRQKIDEEEQWALAASAPYRFAAGEPSIPAGGVHWEWVTGPNWDPVVPDPVTQEYVADGDPVWLASRETWPSETRAEWLMRATASTEPTQGMRTAAAGHIARWDPARVLRLVAAHRKILDEHAPVKMRGLWSEIKRAYDIEIACPTCAWIGDDEDRGGNRFRNLEHADAPCDTLLALAEVYGLEDSTEEGRSG